MKIDKELQIFNNKELNLSIRAFENNDDGSISVNLEDAARGLGFVDKSKFVTSGETTLDGIESINILKSLAFLNMLGKILLFPNQYFIY